jgi:hypothetical protein
VGEANRNTRRNSWMNFFVRGPISPSEISPLQI